jgi:hypothetical protein
VHLRPYLRGGSIVSWSDQQIAPGSEWFREIQSALTNSKIAVLLVSPDFLASDFIHEHELGPLLKEAKQGGVKILWVPVRAAAYKRTPLKNYQAVLDPSKPLAAMTKARRDQAWVKICEEIQKPREIKAPEGAEEISFEHVALLHSSWRYPKKDAEFGRPIWAFHLIVVAADEVLDRIDSVTYTLHPSYGERERQEIRDRTSNFALKELAWAESIVRATITIRNQQTLVKLNRYINLTETGPRL